MDPSFPPRLLIRLQPMTRRFAEDLVSATAEDRACLSELADILNSCVRRAVSQGIKLGANPDKESMTRAWAETAGTFKATRVGLDAVHRLEDLGLTGDQKDQVLRKAIEIRQTDIASAKWASGVHSELADACSAKRIKVEADLAALLRPRASAGSFERASSRGRAGGEHKRTAAAERLAAAIGSLKSREKSLRSRSTKLLAEV